MIESEQRVKGKRCLCGGRQEQCPTTSETSLTGITSLLKVIESNSTPYDFIPMESRHRSPSLWFVKNRAILLGMTEHSQAECKNTF